MASVVSVTANSLDAQVEQLFKQFAPIEKSAIAFENQEGRARAILYQTLAQIFEFGEAIYSIRSQPGTSLFRKFFDRMKISYDQRSRANPYIGLVKLAFRTTAIGAASQSQYSTVLHFAHSEGIAPAAFQQWLADKGIEGRRTEALDRLNSRQRALNNQTRTARLQKATSALMAKPASQAVALPAGIKAPEGFAVVLARIDGSNNASIVEVVHTDAEKVDPILLSLTATKARVASSEPLAPFFRAVDLILNTTPDKPGADRDLLICNRDENGTAKALVQAISQTNSFPGALMELAEPIAALPLDRPFVLKADEARHLLKQMDKFANWSVDEDGNLTADGFADPIQLHALEDAGKYRVAVPIQNDDKPLKITHAEFTALASYFEWERASHAKRFKDYPEKRPFPASVELEIDGAQLLCRLPTTERRVTIGETSAETDLDDRLLSVSDLEALSSTLKRHEVDADGWLMDGDVDDAAIVIEAFFDADLLRIVLPTRTGSSYNQVCEPLTL